MEDSQLSTFGELLKAFRKQRRITQHELATRIGAHRNTIGVWERGDFLPESKTMVLEVVHHLRLNTQEARRLLEASMTALSPYWHMPYQRNPFFTGREEVLLQLHDTLAHERTAVLSQSYALSGLGGIGKTQTAIEYAYRYANDYSAIFWISAETHANIVSSMIDIAMLLNLPEKQEQDLEKVATAVTRWLNNHSGWLLILDNVEDPALVKRFLPHARSGALLFTTRLQAMGTLAQILSLPLLPSHEGADLLIQRARSLSLEALPLSEEEDAAAQIIVQEMGGLPLAIDQAGAYVQATGCSFTAFLAILHSEFFFLLQQREDLTDYPYSVAAMVMLAFQKLQAQDGMAAQLLMFCAFLAPDAIPEILFQQWIAHTNGGTDPQQQQLHVLFKAILAYALLSPTEPSGTFNIHRLIQIILRAQMEQKDQQEMTGLVVHIVNQSFPETTDSNNEASIWRLCQSLVPHAEMCIVFIEQGGHISSEAGQLLLKAGSYFRERAEYTKAERYLEKARDLWIQLKETNASALADTLCHLAVLYYYQGKYQPMEAFLSQSLVLQEENGRQDQRVLATTYQFLGILFMCKGEYEVAKDHMQHALEILEHQLGREHMKLIDILHCLMELYRRQQNYEVAASLGHRALSMSIHQWGPNHPFIANMNNGLALIYRDQLKFREAEDLFKQSLDIYNHFVGPDHPYTAMVMNNLGVLYVYQKRWSDARPLFEHALQIRETVLGPEHLDTARSLFDLAEVFRAEQHYTQAELLHRRSLVIKEKIWGLEYPARADSLEALATVYVEQGKYVEAKPLYLQAITIREQKLGPEHPKTCKIRNDFAHLLQDLEQTDTAEQLTLPTSIQQPTLEVSNNAEVTVEQSRGEYPPCPVCQRTDAVIRSGVNRTGTRRFRCRSCQRYFTPNSKPRGYDISVKAQALALASIGTNSREIAQQLNVNHSTISLWIKEDQKSSTEKNCDK